MEALSTRQQKMADEYYRGNIGKLISFYKKNHPETSMQDIESDIGIAVIQAIKNYKPARTEHYESWIWKKIQYILFDLYRQREGRCGLERIAKIRVNHPLLFSVLEAGLKKHRGGKASIEDILPVKEEKKVISKEYIDLFWKYVMKKILKKIKGVDRMIFMAFFREGQTMKNIGITCCCCESRISMRIKDIMQVIEKTISVEDKQILRGYIV